MNPYDNIIIKFPKNFIERVKAEFPEVPTLHKALDNGKLFLVGKILINIYNLFAKNSIREIKNSQGKKRENEINERFDKAKRYDYLYQEWKIYCFIHKLCLK
ncbi:hypothetical protein KJ671_00105 [Patescibacteria group bacterium]|nr:hypothetical protein [Patescibacteria group bacterium]